MKIKTISLPAIAAVVITAAPGHANSYTETPPMYLKN